MAKRTLTIKIDQKTRDFYRNMYLARKLHVWVDMYRKLHNCFFDDDIEDLSDEEIIKLLGDKESAKTHLSASEYADYLNCYDEIYTRG